MARYLISFDRGWMAFPEEDLPEVAEAAHAAVQEAHDAGVFVFGGGIGDEEQTTLVAVDGTATDGPYPETKEHDRRLRGPRRPHASRRRRVGRQDRGRVPMCAGGPRVPPRPERRRVARALSDEDDEMPKYLLSVYGPAESNEFGNYATKEDMLQAFEDTGAFNDKLVAEGYFVFADGLEPASTATVVDGQGDQPAFSDGPYLESKEYIGGFWVIEAPDLDVVLRLAAEGSKACRGKVEVRPFQTEDSFEALLES